MYVYMYGYVCMYFTNIEYPHFYLFIYIFTFGNTYAWLSIGFYGPEGQFSETNASCQTRSETKVWEEY